MSLRHQFPLWFLAAFLVLAEGSQVHLASAQDPHVHEWTAGPAPVIQLTMVHADGRSVTNEDPPVPCDVTQIISYLSYDDDVCIAAGCPYPNGVSREQPFTMTDLQCSQDTGYPIVYSETTGRYELLAEPVEAGLETGAEEAQYVLPAVPVGDPLPYLISPLAAGPRQAEICLGIEDVDTRYQEGPLPPQSLIVPIGSGPPCDVTLIRDGGDGGHGGGGGGGGGGADTGGDGAQHGLCGCAACETMPGHSSIAPAEGNLSFEVPVTQWVYRGANIHLNLTYNSHSDADASLANYPPWHPGALSDHRRGLGYNPKWTHTFAQWVEKSASGEGYVWTRSDGHRILFPARSWDAVTKTWTGAADDSFNSFTAYKEGPDKFTIVYGPSSDANGNQIAPKPILVTTDTGSVVLHDGHGTYYRFEKIFWQKKDGFDAYAFPYWLLSSIRDRWGRQLTVQWSTPTTEGHISVQRVSDGDGRQLLFNLDGDGLISSIQDPYGRVHSLARSNYGANSQRRLTGATVLGPGSPNRAVRSWSFNYGGPNSDLVVFKREPAGKAVHYSYEIPPEPRLVDNDFDGRLTEAYTESEGTTRGLLIQRLGPGEMVYPGNQRFLFEYTGHHITQINNVNRGTIVNYQYDQWGNRISSSINGTSLGTTTYTYGRLFAREITGFIENSPTGLTTEVTIGNWNLPLQVQVKTPARSEYSANFFYDGAESPYGGNLLRTVLTGFDGATDRIDYTYNVLTAPDAPNSVTDYLGRTINFAFTAEGRLGQAAGPPNYYNPSSPADQASAVTTIEYDADGMPARILDPLGREVILTYNADAFGSSLLVVTARRTSDGATSFSTYDAAGRLVRSVDTNGITSTISYNSDGSPDTITSALGTPDERTARYYYNEAGDLSAFDPPGGQTARVRFEYVRYDYAGTGSPVLSNPSVYTGQLSRILYADGTSEYFGYNERGQPVWRYDQAGGVTTIQYDQYLRPNIIEYPGRSGYSSIPIVINYDEMGRVRSVSDEQGISSTTYDGLGRTATHSPSAGQSISYQYLADFTNKRRIERVILNGLSTWEFGEDSKGRLCEVLNPLNQLTRTLHDAADQPIARYLSNGASQLYSYTPQGFLQSVQMRLSNNNVLDQLNYDYLPSGHLIRETDIGGRVHAFNYNNNYQLVGESHPDFGTILYNYDLNGNRVSRSTNGSVEYYGYDNQNKLLWINSAANAPPTPNQTRAYRSYIYDVLGQPTDIDHRDMDGGGIVHDRYDWDGMGKLRRISCVGANQERYTAEYDAAGIRTRSRQNGIDHVYSFGAGLLIDSAGVLYTPGSSQRSAGTDSFFHTDRLGSTRYLTDASGANTQSSYRYDAFGRISAQAGADLTSKKFAGEWDYQSDAPGLQLLGQRYYDPFAGRFLSPDPIGYAGGLNLYDYCVGDPVNLIDPKGLSPADVLGSIWNWFTQPITSVRKTFFQVKMKPGTPTFRDANPYYRDALLRGGGEINEITDAYVEAEFSRGFAVVQGVRSAASTATGAGTALCARSPGPIHRHHLLPQQFRSRFKAGDIDIDRYIVKINADYHRRVIHRGRGGGDWNAEWDMFLKKWDPVGKNAIKKVHKQLEKMLERYGLENLPFEP